MFVAGIDAHATYSVIAIVSNTGQLVAGPIRIKNTQEDRLDDLLQRYQPLEVVVETSPAWPWLFDRLQGQWGSTSCSLMPSGCASSPSPTTRVTTSTRSCWRVCDSRASFPRSIRSALEQREQAVLLRNRARLVRERTRMVNRIHSQLHNVGLHLERGRLLTQDGREWVHDVAWPLLGDERRLFIEMQWALVDQNRTDDPDPGSQGRACGPRDPSRSPARDRPGHRSLPGICSSPPRRCPSSDSVHPGTWSATPVSLHAPHSRGLRPIRHGSIPAGANRWLRGTFVRTVVSHVTHAPDSWLSQSYELIRQRLGWQVARIATARRLARAVHAMLRTGEVWHDEPVTRAKLRVTYHDGPYHDRGELRAQHVARRPSDSD